MNETRQVCAYARVSTPGQAETGVSLEVQEAALRAWAAAKGLPIRLYVDRGISAKHMDNRPELQRALKEVKRTKGILLVYALSRANRNLIECCQLAEELKEAAADLVSLTEIWDTTQPMGWFMFVMFAAFAELERKLISQRTKAGMATKRAKGESTAVPPYGYSIHPTALVQTKNGMKLGRLVPNESEQLGLAKMVRLRAEGLGLRKIAAALDAAGVKPRSGSLWHPGSIARILRRAEQGTAE
jgi:site-specific DNA recombinase